MTSKKVDNGDPPSKKVKKELTEKERQSVCYALLSHVDNKTLPRGVILSIAKKFEVDRSTISRLWTKHIKVHVENDQLEKIDVSGKKASRGTKRIYDPISLEEEIKNIPKSQRTTVRATAHALKVGTKTVMNLKKEGTIKVCNSSVRPLLQDHHKIARYMFCANEVNDDGTIKTMLDRVHIDEKNFQLCPEKTRYYLTEGEEPPVRRVQHKSHIPKVTVIAAVAEPRTCPRTGEFWDGKIGVWAFYEKVEAKRDSKNRPAGTIEWVPYTVDNKAYSNYLVTKIIPAIGEKWPKWDKHKDIKIQADNAPAHSHVHAASFSKAVKRTKLNISLYKQPAQSPDLNILDLGFFRAIQSLQQKNPQFNIKNLIGAVENSWNEISPDVLRYNFLSLKSNMAQILEDFGNNGKHTQHMGKKKLDNDNKFPSTISVTPRTLKEINSFLKK